MIEVWGVLPGEFMGAIFSMLTPIRSMTKYNLDLLEVVDDEAKLLNYLRMEKWLADWPHHAGEAAKQWLKDFYQDNKLIKSELELGGRKVDLRQVTMPVLNIYAQDDHIIPPPTSRALEGKVGTKDYTELGLPGGHRRVRLGQVARHCRQGHRRLAGAAGQLTGEGRCPDAQQGRERCRGSGDYSPGRHGGDLGVRRRRHARGGLPGARGAVPRHRPAPQPGPPVRSRTRRRQGQRSQPPGARGPRAARRRWALVLVPKLGRMAAEGRIEAWNLPLGCVSQLFREIAGRRPGLISRVGLGTFVDPRQEGGKLNALSTDDLVQVIEIGGQEWLFYQAFPVQVAIIRGTTADPEGNISMEREALILDNLAIAMAAKASKGFVIAQVERLAAAGLAGQAGGGAGGAGRLRRGRRS